MLSEFWTACSDGNVQLAVDLFNGPTPVDVELKDEFGNTALVQAVKNSHVEIIKFLIEKGANASLPVDHTTDPVILELLGVHVPQTQSKPVYYHPPGAYPYFHPDNPMSDGAAYYAPYPPTNAEGQGPPSSGPGNLPPPEIARFIPCRYYPACRYGPSCMFAHPPPGPYMSAPVPPPGSYPYDPMSPHPYQPNFYPPPQSFQQNAIPPHINGTPSPGPPLPNGALSPAAALSPQQPPYSPNGTPAQAPYTAVSPVSPSSYPLPLQIPAPPIHNGAGSPTVPFSPGHQLPFVHRPDNPYGPPMPNGMSNGNGHPYSPSEPRKLPMNGDAEGGHGVHSRENGHFRRGSGIRGSFGRKPPCLFFPMGKCKNGNECRFPHVMPENIPGRGGPRPGRPHVNGIDPLSAKMGHMNMNGRGMNGYGGRGSKPFNGARNDKKPFATKQRVPSADDFPVLAGSVSPPLRSPGINGNGAFQTAAQILQAPPPRKEVPSASDTRVPSPVTPHSVEKESPQLDTHELVQVEPEPSPPSPVAKKPPMSFAAIAAPEVSKEQSVSA